MAKKTSTQATLQFKGNAKSSRPGIHSKTEQTKNKGSKNYSKPYGGQGR
jgi:hypothetical protein